MVQGNAIGEILFTDRYISFLGDVNQDSGVLIGLGAVKDKILMFPGSRGSTVGPYVIYSLAKRSLGPRAMVVRDLDPLLIAGSILSNIPLAMVIDWRGLAEFVREACGRGCTGRLLCDSGVLEVE